MPFDPQKELSVLYQPIGGVEWSKSCNGTAEDLRKSGVAGRSLATYVSKGIYCYLVGREVDASWLLNEADQGFQIAWERRNLIPPNPRLRAGLRDWSHDHLQVRWLATGIQDSGLAAEASLITRAYVDEEMAKPKEVRQFLEYNVEDILDIRDADLFFHTVERSGMTFSRARSLAHYQRPPVIAWILLGDEFSEDEKWHWLMKFMDSQVDEWLSNGHSARAALWAKIAYVDQHQKALTPKQTIMKLYNHLPGREPLPPDAQPLPTW